MATTFGRVPSFAGGPSPSHRFTNAAEPKSPDSSPENAAITKAILKDELRGPKRDIVLINAAASLLAATRVGDLAAGIEAAAKSIDSGAALDKLERLIAFSRQ